MASSQRNAKKPVESESKKGKGSTYDPRPIKNVAPPSQRRGQPYTMEVLTKALNNKKDPLHKVAVERRAQQDAFNAAINDKNSELHNNAMAIRMNIKAFNASKSPEDKEALNKSVQAFRMNYEASKKASPNKP